MASFAEQLRGASARRACAASVQELQELEAELDALQQAAGTGPVWDKAGLKLAT